MDPKTKKIVIGVVALIAAVVLVKLVWRFWIFLIVGGVCFAAGYGLAIYQRYQKRKKKK